MSPLKIPNPFGGGGKEAQPPGGGSVRKWGIDRPVPPPAPESAVNTLASSTVIEKPPETASQIAERKLKEARRETASINHKLMDQMEESAPENGSFYFKLGRKSEDGKTDNRVLILNEGRRTDEGKFEYATITDMGSMKMTLVKELADWDMRKRLSEFKYIYEHNSREGDHRIVDYSLDLSGGDASEIKLSPIGDADQDFLNEAMTKSIEKARATSENAKIKAGLEAEQKKQATAKGLLDLFNKAIQPPTGEGPAAPTASTPPSAPLS